MLYLSSEFHHTNEVNAFGVFGTRFTLVAAIVQVREFLGNNKSGIKIGVKDGRNAR